MILNNTATSNAADNVPPNDNSLTSSQHHGRVRGHPTNPTKKDSSVNVNVVETAPETEPNSQKETNKETIATSGISINTDASIPSSTTNSINNNSRSSKEKRCALCFFGLPRSYATMVLPSIEKHILKPNAHHLCDIFVHYFHQTNEAAGRYNNGGDINPDEILMLQKSVEKLYYQTTLMNSTTSTITTTSRGTTTAKLTILFANDTNETFFEKQSTNLHKYHTTLDRKGHQMYFPWRSNWSNSSLDNMIRQWHSIEGVFDMMSRYQKQHPSIEYTRVAMLRNDVVYLTPIDIMKMDNGTLDTNNEYYVIPNFAKYPMSDRMIYGPYNAVQVWAKQRFQLVEQRIQTQQDFGWKMHSERFMNSTVLPTIQALGYQRNLNRDICFFRARTGQMLMASDCFMAGSVRGFVKNQTNIRKVVEDTVDRNCSNVIIDEKDTNIHFLYC